MLSRLIFIFVAVPLVELAILLRIGQWIGLMPTVALVVTTGVAGAALARQQGVRAFLAVQRELASGRLPGRSLLDGLAILVGGALLLTPGRADRPGGVQPADSGVAAVAAEAGPAQSGAPRPRRQRRVPGLRPGTARPRPGARKCAPAVPAPSLPDEPRHRLPGAPARRPGPVGFRIARGTRLDGRGGVVRRELVRRRRQQLRGPCVPRRGPWSFSPATSTRSGCRSPTPTSRGCSTSAGSAAGTRRCWSDSACACWVPGATFRA